MNVELKFKDPIANETQGLKLIFLMEWDETIYCDRNRNFIPGNLSQ